jgi:predicted PurR-regulated permease PerM
MWRWTLGAISLWWVSGLIAGTVSALQDFLVVAVVAFLVACALEQPVRWLELKGLRRGIGTAVVMASAAIASVGVGVLGGTVVMSQARSLQTAAPQMFQGVSELLARVGIQIDGQQVGQRALEAVSSLIEQNVGAMLLQGGLLVGKVALGAFLVFYLVADGPRLRRSVCALLAPAHQQRVLDVWTAAIEKAGGYFIVRALLAAVSAAAHWAFFSALGVPYALALALWVGVVSQLIPAVGTYLAGALPVLVAAGVSMSMVLAVLAVVIAYQQAENYWLAPRISRRVMHVHPAVALTSALCGAVIAGPAGAIIAVPLVATVQAVLSASLGRHELVDSVLFHQVGEHGQEEPSDPDGQQSSLDPESGTDTPAQGS